MTIVVVCSQCGHRAGAKDEWAGKRLKCPACGNPVTVPGSAPAAFSSNAEERQEGPQAAALAPWRLRQPPEPDFFGSGAVVDPFAGAATAPRGPVLGPPLAGPRKASDPTKIALIVVAMVSGVMLFGCVGLAALLLPAVHRAREFARANAVGDAAPNASSPVPNASVPLPDDLPVWTPDPVRAAQLGDEVMFEKYAIRIPKGHGPTPIPNLGAPPAGNRVQIWACAGPPSPRGDRNVITATLLDTPDLSISGSLDQAVEVFLLGIRGAATVKVGPKKKGRLIGRPSVRVQYTISHPNGVVQQVITYLGVDGNREIVVTSACAEADGSETHRLLETSLLTLSER